jgi:hypothetical protein
METVNVKIIHPTNNSDIDIGLPDSILLRDVFSQLIDANFLSSGQPYTGVLKPSGERRESVNLDNDKSIGQNSVGNNDTIQTIIATQAGSETVNVKIIHPTNNSDIDIGLPDNILLRDVFSQLIDANFISSGQPYTGVLKPSGERRESVNLDNDKSISQNGVGNNDTIQTIIATQAG